MKEEAIDKIGKYKRVEAGSKKSFGNFEADLVNKVSSYCTLIDMDRTKYITNLIEKDLENKVLANDFMVLEHYFYFNWEELLENKTVKASTVKPIHNLRDYYVLKKISNNLDKFSAEYNSFCYGNNPANHRGFYFLPRTKKSDNGLTILTYILVFDYDISNNSLIISLIDKKEDLMLLRMDTTAEAFFSNLQDYIKSIITKDNEINLMVLYSEIPIIENYYNRKMIESFEKYGNLKEMKENLIPVKEEAAIPEDVIPYIALHDVEDPYLEEMKQHLNNLEEIQLDVEIYGMESKDKKIFYFERE